MGTQLMLFENTTPNKTEKTCSICHKNPLGKNGLGILWNGFKDSDMNVLVCWNCRDIHYKNKALTSFKNLHSETPVPYD